MNFISQEQFWDKLWQKMDTSNVSESQLVPESFSAIGLLGLGLVGICSFLKKRSR